MSCSIAQHLPLDARFTRQQVHQGRQVALESKRGHILLGFQPLQGSAFLQQALARAHAFRAHGQLQPLLDLLQGQLDRILVARPQIVVDALHDLA